MSVINQMLKDLDERQNEHHANELAGARVNVANSSKKMLVVIVTVLVLINIAGVFVWQLYKENQDLKAQTPREKTSSPVVANTALPIPNTPEEPRKDNKTIIRKQSVEQSPKSPLLGKNIPKQANEKVQNAPNKTPTQLQSSSASVSASTNQEVTPNVEQEPLPTASVDTIGTSRVTSIPSISKVTGQEEEPKLTISRTRLSPDELARNKMQQAEQALNANAIEQAENLYEEVLLISPTNRRARKKLAALWFGKKDYQAALNVLSQGIANTDNDSDYRLMKARIYLNQGQVLSAVNVLKVKSNNAEVEYQALLATSAQQIQQHNVAISAYQMLVKLQPSVGRWWLGLATSLDSNSQFDEATQAYSKALNQGDLSQSAQQFARQRILELGE